MKNIKFNKAFGQNFIFDNNLLKAIVLDANISKDSEVLEIGTGAGTLTKTISQFAKKVVSYEIDESLKEVIDENLTNVSNVKVIFKDIMQEDISIIESNFNGNYVMIANLPYYITTPIIFKFIDNAKNLLSMNIMVQKEVAQRLCAKENTSDYGAITVVINAIANTKITRIVNRKMFIPSPNVDSAIVQINFDKNKYKINNFDIFKRVVKSAFNMRRKTLMNNLKKDFSFSNEIIAKLLNDLSLPINVRGEVLSPKQFVDLSNLIYKIEK